MKHLTGIGVVAATALATFMGITSIHGPIGAHATTAVPVSGDVTKIPPRPDISYAPLPTSQVTVSAQDAISMAEARLHLPDSSLDPGVGVVRAVVTIRGTTQHRADKAWVVTAWDDIRSPGTGVLYHRVCVAIDANTGRFLYTYATDPSRS